MCKIDFFAAATMIAGTHF